MVFLLLDQEVRDFHKIVREYCGTHQQLEVLTALDESSLHSTAVKEYGDASLNAGAESLPLLEGRAFFVSFALRCLLSATLWDAHDCDTGFMA